MRSYPESAMFEPLKLISVALALLLLIPFGCLFWRLAAHPSASESDLRVHAARALEDHKKRLGTTDAEGGWYVGGGVRIVERIGFSAQTESWLSFYPRRWVGWLGFTAIAVILFCVVFSLFFPRALASAEIWHETPPKIELH